MNTLKRIFAIALCFLLSLTCLAGCHQKGEIAVKIGDIEFTAGYYACALVFSDSEARTTVQENLSDEEDADTSNIDYYKQKIDDTDYVEWVENNALDTLKKVAAVKTLCKEANIEIDDETKEQANSYAEYLWDSCGYSELLSQNGVSEETFKLYWRDSYLKNEYFEYLYSTDGEKEIAADQVSKQLAENYVLVNKIEVSFSSLSDDAMSAKKEQFASYETALRDGSKTFEDVYLEYNEISAEDHTHEEAEDGELQPLDHHATVLGGEDTNYESDYYETAMAMAVGEVKTVILDDDIGLVLLVKKDISADPYYLENMDTTLRYDISGEDFEADIANYGKELDCDINSYSVKQFKVKKIEYPETSY